MDIQSQILEKRREMEELQEQMRTLNQKHLEALYPGRCFQYCIDQLLFTEDQLFHLPETEIILEAEKAHFAAIARKTWWPCGGEGCKGWNNVGKTCECGAKQFYWIYEEKLPLSEVIISQQPAASGMEQ